MREIFLLTSIILLSLFAKAQTLVNIGSSEVSVPEFLWVYNKGNGLDNSLNKKDIDSYLDMYIRFKMKVLDAESLGLDKEKAFIEELSGYRTRLAERYLLEREVSDKLVEEAYERSLKIINASHILILCPPDASPADTLTAFQKINSIRENALAGKPFEELASEFSEEPGAEASKGNLGDFTVFQMTYPFETAAYHTPKGKVSEIVRSRFGYHVIKVNDVKLNPGQVEIAHILISEQSSVTNNNKSDGQAKAVEIYERLLQGADFAMMAKQFSDDKFSSENGGVLQIINSGRSDRKLETAALALSQPGDISAPIKTAYGWHIIRLIRKIPVGTFENLRSQLVSRVAADERSILGRNFFVERLKKQNDFKEATSIADKPEVLFNKMSSPERNGNDLLFSFSNEKVLLNDFLKFAALYKRDEQSIGDLYKQFVQHKLTAFENEHLEEKYPDFRYLLNEYRNGILLFNLSEKKIWNYAQSDSAKLIEFYNSRAAEYSWKERADAKIYMVSSVKDLATVKNMLSLNKSDDEILNLINKSSPINLVINAGRFERGSHSFLDRAKWQSNSETEVSIGNALALVKIRAILPPSKKSIDEVQDVLLIDYEKYLENQWLKELAVKYPVRINQAQLKKISR